MESATWDAAYAGRLLFYCFVSTGNMNIRRSRTELPMVSLAVYSSQASTG